ncbi:aKG-HExxH-type peptide beta-hydroxylase [Streptomyces microflavus]|uniref:aKG-HExxH-type peptide beta-hydroxylase n=1 Tax=Streptomyces microflavus TaxID=1919 RepID=UPI002E2FDA12|nr:HEXXH motif-containing putative peptide modification protein [Streptomyces microflavus]
MAATALDFAFSPIQDLHRHRTRQIHSLFPASADWTKRPADAYCLAHHALEGAETAARVGDAHAFEWYQAHPDANGAALATPSSVGPRIVLSPDPSRMPRSPISDTAYYVLGPDPALAPADELALTTAAYETATQNGFGSLLADHAVITCLLRRKTLDDTLVSWAITRLPGTVYTDHVDDPVVLARDQIHEAGHNWLNDALTSTGCKLSEKATFHSPWRNSQRPAFGFLHACWAFPLTMIYTARVLNQTEGAVYQFLARYLAQQRRLLATTTTDHATALALVPHPALRNRLRHVYTAALSL